MATRNIVPRADGEGQVGLAAQAWGKVYADEIYEGGVRVQTGESSDDKTVKASSTDETPGFLDAKVDNATIEVANDKLRLKSGGHTHAQSEVTDLVTALSGKAASTHSHAQSEVTGLADSLAGKASTDAATTSAAGLMSAADKAKLDGITGSGGGVSLTLVHTTETQTTTSATYENLYSGSIVARKAWHSATLAALVQRSGAGQVRVTVTDGMHTTQSEGAAFTAEGQDALVLDCSTLNDNAIWTITVAALTSSGTVTLSRVKITADPVDAMSPPLAASGAGSSSNATTWTELASATILPTALQPDGASGVILSGAATLTGATGAEIRVTISGTVGATTTSETATATITASGVFRLDCRYPAIAAATMAVRIDGRVTAGSGTIALGAWQLNIEQ